MAHIIINLIDGSQVCEVALVATRGTRGVDRCLPTAGAGCYSRTDLSLFYSSHLLPARWRRRRRENGGMRIKFDTRARFARLVSCRVCRRIASAQQTTSTLNLRERATHTHG